MKHKHPECYICGTNSRYSTPVFGYVLCQPCHYKLVKIGEANIKGIQEAKNIKEN